MAEDQIKLLDDIYITELHFLNEKCDSELINYSLKRIVDLGLSKKQIQDFNKFIS